ncbi:fibrinogen C domain-containing protein 1-like isoform X1 [Procambarus clarkii]|uniref:fibrinogen C domain-containing protein 1-like isoform X1 n=1 Tax=Procambarus clarkii TaxID=6728 RepID=UPI0037423098
MSVCLLPLLCVLVGWSAAFPEATMGLTKEFDLTPTVIFNQIALRQLQEEQGSVQEGVRSMLMVMANLTDLISTHLTLDDKYTQGVKERENATRRLLDTLDQLECVNKAHQADNLKLKEENTRVYTANLLLEEDNRKTKNEVRLAQEEIVILKSQIRQLEEDSRLVKEEIRQVEEDSRLVKEDNRKAKNDVRLSQEENIQLKSQIRQVQEDSRLVKEDNMKTKNEVGLAQEEIILLKSQIRLLEEDSRQVKEEIRQVEEDSRLVNEENRKTKNDVRLSEEANRRLMADIRQVEEEWRLVKTRNQQLELAETQAQERVKTALTRIAELERETQLLQDMNNNTAEEKRLVEEQLSVSEEEASKLRVGNTVLQTDKDRQAQQLRSIQEEKNILAEKSRLMEEEHEKCKRNVSEQITRVPVAKDCAEHYCWGVRRDGVYLIKPDREGRLVSAWCDMTTDGGGWTVFLQRDERVVPGVNFIRDWQAYKTSFGDASTEYWLGTEAVHQLTQSSPQTVRLAATNKQDDHRWALWSTFSVASESTGYQLLVAGYQRRSTMGDVLVQHQNLSGMKFSTMDRDNDLNSGGTCAKDQGGWWYRSCTLVGGTAVRGNMGAWYWTPGVRGSFWEPLQQLQMMMRPQNFTTCQQ